jgi:condensation domain-containing protein/AMP-binding enzyme
VASKAGGSGVDAALADAFIGAAEAALFESPLVRDAVVVQIGHGPPGPLVALIVPATGFSLADVDRFLVEQLPAPARPEEIVVVSALPRAPTGSVDRAQASGLAALGSGPAPTATGGPWRSSVLQENRVLRAAHGWTSGPQTLDSVMVRMLRLRGAIDRELWERVIGEVVRRHESLRTRFLLDDGAVFCEPLPHRGIDFTVKPLGRDDTHGRRLVDNLTTGTSRRFCNGGELLRAELLVESDDEATLCLFADHLVMDEWSFDLIEAECAEICAGLTAGRPSPAPFRPPYREWAAWQRDMLRSAAGVRKLSRWRQLLGPAGPFPTLAGVDDVDGDALRRVQWLTAEGPRGWFPLLERTAGVHRLSPFMLALWAAQAALALALDTESIVVHSSTSNRLRPAAREVVGYLAHGVAFPFRVQQSATLAESVGQGRAQTLRCYEVQDIPLTSIVKALDPDAHGSVRSRRPPRCYFSYEAPTRAERHILPTGTLERLPLPLCPPAAAQPGIGLDLSFRSDRPRLDLTFGEGAICPERAEDIASLFWDLVAALPAHSELPLSTLAARSRSERREPTLVTGRAG